MSGRPKPKGAHAGVISGYDPNCMCPDCRRARKRYDTQRERDRAAGITYTVDPAATRRKLEALACLGWSASELGRRMDPPRGQQTMSKLFRTTSYILRRTAERVDALYRELEMTFSDEYHAPRNISQARRKGYLPPLAWEDIDAGILAEEDESTANWHDTIDPVAVERAVQYRDFSLHFTRAEREEIVRRWLADGRTQYSLEALTGWRLTRYTPRRAS